MAHPSGSLESLVGATMPSRDAGRNDLMIRIERMKRTLTDDCKSKRLVRIRTHRIGGSRPSRPSSFSERHIATLHLPTRDERGGGSLPSFWPRTKVLPRRLREPPEAPARLIEAERRSPERL